MSFRLETTQRDAAFTESSERLGAFHVAHEIAQGGMANVYLGYRGGLFGFAQAAAIKVIHPHLAADRDYVEMFVDEARIAACVNHPNVCKALDFGKADETLYLAMEYVPGENWARVLEALHADDVLRPVISGIVAHVLAQACEGLHAAHEARDHRGAKLHVVHRDVSPQNLLIGYDGSVRVVDFGVARALDRLHTTRAGTLKGRYCYMAPEQMLGTGVDRRSDVWSLGVVLRESLTGKPLFRRDTDAETMHAILHERIPAWETKVDPALKAIADTALQLDRSCRYTSARQMGRELRRFALSRTEPVGMSEVSGCMQRLFGADEERKRCQLTEAAERVLPPGPGRAIAARVLGLDNEGLTWSHRMRPTRSSAPRIAAPLPESECDEKTLERLDPTRVAQAAELEESFLRVKAFEEAPTSSSVRGRPARRDEPLPVPLEEAATNALVRLSPFSLEGKARSTPSLMSAQSPPPSSWLKRAWHFFYRAARMTFTRTSRIFLGRTFGF